LNQTGGNFSEQHAESNENPTKSGEAKRRAASERESNLQSEEGDTKIKGESESGAGNYESGDRWEI
jgi:hypothetical protein